MSNIQKAQKIFNEYIRLRDSFIIDGERFGRCISCNKIIRYGSNWQAGHYIPSTKGALRFDEQNVNGQCKQCNYFKHGNLTNYRIGLVKKIGIENVESLEIRQNLTTRLYGFYIDDIIKEYKEKVKELKKREE